MSSSTRIYLVDCSRLSSDEFKEIYQMFDTYSFLLSIVLKQPRTFQAVWDLPDSPNQLMTLPPNCIIREIAK